MESITLFTYETEDVEQGVADLMGQMDDFALRAHSLGIMFVPVDIDIEPLIKALKEKLDIPIVGTTGMSLFNDKCGYQVNGMSLQILTADDCEFAAGISGEITGDDLDEKISLLCRGLREKMQTEPKVALTYLAMAPLQSGDNYLAVMQRELEGLPVYGGVAMGDFSLDGTFVLLDETVRSCGALMVLIGGAVRPLLHCEYSAEEELALPGEAVCENGQVLRLGSKSPAEVLNEAGIRAISPNVLLEFVSMPFLAEMPMEDGETLRVVRQLQDLDDNDGRATFIGNIKDGTHFAIATLRPDRLKASVGDAINSLIAKMEAERDYCYSALICTSCAARELALAGEAADEGDAILSVLPATLSLSGMYSFGELCPLKGKSGKTYNMFHNTAFTILAL